MFSTCSNLTNISALANWNTGAVIDMRYMFYNTKISDVSALANWNVSSVTNMYAMFSSV